MDIIKKFEQACESLDPRIQDALKKLARGEITKDEFNILHFEVYKSTEQKMEEGIRAEKMFKKILAGKITDKDIDAYVEKLNQESGS